MATDNLTSNANQRSEEIVVKVSVKEFGNSMMALGKLGVVVSKNVAGEDVTERVGLAIYGEEALTNRVTTLETELHAGHFSDRRAVQKEQELRDLRSQLSETRAHLGELRRQVALSTIDISLSEPATAAAPAASASSFWAGMHDSNRAAMLAFQAAVRVPLLLAIWAIALSPIWAPLLLLYRYYARKFNTAG